MAFLDLRANDGQEARSGRGVWCAALVLAAAASASYAGTFSVPFLFDDIPSITNNPTLRDLRSSLEPLASPEVRGAGVAGRPVVNLSLAVNRWLGGEEVWGYHLFNLLVHVGAGLALFGVVRRTLRFRREPVRDAERMAFAVALLWLVHPLQTESVTCVIQRTESLMGLFYLLTLYCFARSIHCHPLDDNDNSSPEGKSGICHLMDDNGVGCGVSRWRRSGGWTVLAAGGRCGRWWRAGWARRPKR